MEFYKRDEFKDKCGIYSIVNHLTGDVYIGQTSQEFLKRFFHHDWKLEIVVTITLICKELLICMANNIFHLFL